MTANATITPEAYRASGGRRSKYGAKATEYNGVVYHSKAEAEYAALLDLRVKCGDIKQWWRQQRYPLTAHGQFVCDLIVDFKVLHNDGSIELLEVKGWETPVSRLKRKLFAANYPETKLTVVKK